MIGDRRCREPSGFEQAWYIDNAERSAEFHCLVSKFSVAFSRGEKARIRHANSKIFLETRYELKQRRLIAIESNKEKNKRKEIASIPRPPDFTFIDATRFQQSPDTVTDHDAPAVK